MLFYEILTYLPGPYLMGGKQYIVLQVNASSHHASLGEASTHVDGPNNMIPGDLEHTLMFEQHASNISKIQILPPKTVGGGGAFRPVALGWHLFLGSESHRYLSSDQI